MNLTITDDELVALAVGKGVAYAGPLPTVDAASARGLQSSAWRGQRSLAIRELLDADGKTRGAAREVDAALGADKTLAVFIGDTQLRRIGWGISLVLHPAPNAWLCERVTVDGVHEFATLSREEVVDILSGLIVSATLTPAPDEAELDPWLVVAAVGPEHTHALAAQLGRVCTATVAADGTPVRWAELQHGQVGSWLSGAVANDKHAQEGSNR